MPRERSALVESQWCSQDRIFGEQNRVAPGRAQEVKQGKQNGGGTKGRRGTDPLLGSVSPLHWERCMPNGILNEDKTNVGERLFFELLSEKKWGYKNFLEITPLRTSENTPFNPPPEVQVVAQLFFSDTNPFIFGKGRPLPCPLGYATGERWGQVSGEIAFPTDEGNPMIYECQCSH